MQEGERPLAVGTWFSLGDSTVVFGFIAAFVLSTRAVAGSIPALQSAGAIFGTAISGTFLWVIGLVNVAIALGIYRIFVGLRTGRLNNSADDLLTKRGFLNRYFSPLFKVVKKPWTIP